MGYHLRYQSQPWATHHVVSRCLRGYSFLKPTPTIVKTITGVLGRSLFVYSDCIELHNDVFLSNHFHLLISSKSTNALSEFMKYFKSNLTRELARIHDWTGPMWDKRYSSEEILDVEGMTEVFKYFTENSVKEGLVNHPSEWRGLHGDHQLVDQRKVSGPWLDRTGMYRAKQNPRTRDQATPENFTTTYEVKLTPPPCWKHLSEEEYRRHCATLAQEAVKSAQAKRQGSEPLGMEGVLQEPVCKPRFVKRGQRPLCRTKCVQRLKLYVAEYFNFKAKFQEVYRALREGTLPDIPCLDQLFPPGGFRFFSPSLMTQLE